nr:CDP-glycerol glycerophosphotransferase family protein [Lachnospiraceae bacterium]
MKEVTKYNYTELLDKSDEEIINSVGMAEMPLIVWILEKKYNGEVNLIDIGGDCMIRFGETNVANMSYLATYLHFFYADSETVRMMGNISFPAVFDKRFRFFILLNNEKVYCPLGEDNFDRYVDNSRYEIRNVFDYSFSLKDYISKETDTAVRVSFGFETDGISSICNKINSMRFSPLADVIPGQFYAKDGFVFRIENNSIIGKKTSKEEIREYENEFRKNCKEILSAANNTRNDRSEKKEYFFDYESICSLRDYFYKFTGSDHKPVWVFMDRPDRADDNALVLFEYVQKFEEIDSYYVISDKSDDFKRISSVGKTVPLYSKQHFELALTADCIISSQCNGAVENPFWEYAEYFRDLYHRPKMIFLQHGVIKDDMSLTLNRFNTGFTGFVTSTEDEYCSILNYPYGYTEEEVWLTGLPRYDKLYNDDSKIILIMPSWRKGLMEQTW